MKRFTFLLAFVLLSLSLVWAEDSPVTINFWHAMRGQRGTLLEGVVRRFEAQNPSIKVQLRSVTDQQGGRFGNDYSALYRNLLESLAAGQPPDVAQVYENWSSQLQEVKALENLASPELDATLADMPASLKRGLVGTDGKVYSVPFNKSVWVLYANGALLERCKISPPQTWADLKKCATQVSEQTSLPGLVFRPSVDLLALRALADQGPMLDAQGRPAFDAPAGVAALDYWVSFVHKERSALASPQALDIFMAGNAGFFLDTSSKLGALESRPNIKVRALPMPMGKERVSLVAGTNLAVFSGKDAAHRAASVKLLEYLTSPSVQLTWSQGSGYVPVRQQAVKQASYQDFLKQKPNHAVALEQLKTAQSLPEVAGWETVRGLLDDALLAAISAKGVSRDDLAATLKQVAQQSEQFLSQFRKP